MTEYELISLSYTTISVLQSEETTFLTVLFGYLLAAYFVGAKIPKTQLIIFNAMYLVTILGLAFNMWAVWVDMYGWISASTALSGGQAAMDESVVSGETHTYIANGIYLALIIASLWFMWNVRRAKAE
jgi:hypothetical protein